MTAVAALLGRIRRPKGRHRKPHRTVSWLHPENPDTPGEQK